MVISKGHVFGHLFAIAYVLFFVSKLNVILHEAVARAILSTLPDTLQEITAKPQVRLMLENFTT